MKLFEYIVVSYIGGFVFIILGILSIRHTLRNSEKEINITRTLSGGFTLIFLGILIFIIKIKGWK
jgi:uncharacterized membrane protein HdeD (DUF308 family)